MKTTYINYQILLKKTVVLIGFIVLSSCEPLEVDTPAHLLSGEEVFTNTKTVEAAIISLYANLRDNVLLTGKPNGLSNILGNYTDELMYVGSFGTGDGPFYLNNLSPSDVSISDLWNTSYNVIYGANAIIEGVADSPYFTLEEQETFIGEALFVRGMTHFYLLNIYGDIPYIKTTNYIENKSVKKQPRSEVFKEVITDLLQAYTQLPTTEPSGEKLRPNKYVAAALLARCYLYNKQWGEAEKYAAEVIENNGWESQIQNVYKKTSHSTLWQFSPNMEGLPTHEAQTFIVPFTPPSARVLNEDFINIFKDNDLRKEYWVGEISDADHTFYFPYKYKIGLGENNTDEYSIVFRMAEQYLIRAEARANLSNIPGSQSDLNKIRTRAGLKNTTASSQGDLQIDILEQRRIEFFTEHGHRFFDLKRTNTLNQVLATKPGWNTTDRLFPLPENELLLNPNLQPQNPGY